MCYPNFDLLNGCPYPGLAPFTEAGEQLFFGRHKEIEEIVERLRSYPFLAVVGPSGSGKSSLVRAGVIPALHTQQRLGPGEWTIHTLRPGDGRTLQGKARPVYALAELLGCTTAELTACAFDDRTLLFVDQFEETFTLTSNDEAEAFLDLLQSLIGRRNVLLLIAVRADFYPELMASSLWQTIKAHRFELGAMGDDELRAAIVKPAARLGVAVEEALAQQLVVDASGKPGMLPYVQETLVLLWERSERRQLGLASYRRMLEGADGDLQAAIGLRASLVYESLSDEAKPLARRIFLDLICFGATRPDLCRPRTVEELRAGGDDPALFDSALGILLEHRLLTTRGRAQATSETGALPATCQVDIAHEALITGWPCLQKWQSGRLAATEDWRRLEARAREWRQVGSSRGLLGTCEVQEAESLLKGEHAADLEPSQDLQDLVSASRAALAREEVEKNARHFRQLDRARRAADEQRRLTKASEARMRLAEADADAEHRRRIRLRRAVIGLSLVLVLAFVVTWLVHRQGQITMARSLVAESRLRVHDLDLNHATILALEARDHEPDEAERILGTEIPAAFGSAVLSSVLLGRHGVAVNSVAWSPDGRSLASGSSDGTVKLWDVEQGALIRTYQGHRDWVVSVAWDRQGRTLASASNDGTVRLWSVDQSEATRVLQSSGAEVSNIAWSPDGRTLASATSAGTLELWDVGRGALIQALDSHQARLNAVAWSHDGRILATGADGGTIELWDVERAQRTRTLPMQGGSINSLAWSPDGRLLALASADGAIRLWNMEQRELVHSLDGHRDGVRSIAWSPDGRHLASGSEDGSIRLWDVEQGVAVQTIQGDGGSVNSVAWNPDGRTLASGCYDYTVRLWDVELGEKARSLRGHAGSVNSVAWSPDGRTLASGSDDRTVRLWDVDRIELIQTLPGLRTRILSVAWSPDGRSLALGSDDRSVRIWDVMDGNDVEILQGHGDWVTSVAWSSDGRILATAGSHDRTIRLWDVERRDVVKILRGHEARINSVAWSPDGRTLASGSDDSTIRLWDVEMGSVRVLQAHKDWVTSVAWSPDGRTLASGGSHERSIKLWDVEKGIITHFLDAPREWVLSLAWSPDGSKLVTGTDGRKVYVWDVEQEEIIQTLGSYRSAVGSVAWSPDGRTLASGSADHTIKLLPELFTRHPCSWVYENLNPAQWLQYKAYSIYRPTCPSGASEPPPSLLDAYEDKLEYLLITWLGRIVLCTVCLLCLVLLGLWLRRLKREWDLGV